MGRRPKFFNIKEMFSKHIIKNKETGCWDWGLSVFRYRVFLSPDSVVLNPRRYCAYIHGYNIQAGKQVINGCANPNCINPEHTKLKQDNRPISPHTPFYLTLEDLRNGSNLARRQYGRTMEEMRHARESTIQLIRNIRHEPARKSAEQIAKEYDIGLNYCKIWMNLPYSEFKELLVDPGDTGVTPLDEQGEELRPDAHLF